MEAFLGFIIIIVAIAFWKHVLTGIFGAIIFGLIGSIFGETGGSIGAVIGFIAGVSGTDSEQWDEVKEQFASGGQEKPEPSNQSSAEQTSSQSPSQIIRCPSCARKIRVTTPLPRPTATCPACATAFSMIVDTTGTVIASIEQRHSSRSEQPSQGSSTADYYDVLGVSTSSTPEEVRQAYKKKIREYHPDKVAGLGEKLRDVANEESRSINNAYTMLKAAGLAS